MKLSQLPVGALVKDPNTKYNNDVIIWQVLEHGHSGDPSGSTTLQSRDILTLKCFDAKEPNNSNNDRKQYGNNRYKYSNILQWLNKDSSSWYEAQHTADQEPSASYVWSGYNEYDAESGFLTNFSKQFKNALMDVSKVTVKPSVDGGGTETVSGKIHLLSTTEVGLANENSIAEGSKYSLYNTASYRVKNLMNNAAKGNYSSATSPWYWWLRTPNSGKSHGARNVYTDGTLTGTYAYNGINGVRPALCISSDTEVSDEPDASNVYTLQFAPSCVKAYIGDANGEAVLVWGRPKIVSWADGTDKELAAMLKAHYAGTIDIHDYWNVGDERTVSLSAMSATGVGESHVAQNVTMVLMNAGGKKLADGVTDCAFVVGQKNLLANGTTSEGGYMNSSNTNAGGWKGSARRTWCNETYYNAIASGFKALLKQFINKSGTGGGSSSGTEDTTDWTALPAEVEVFGSTTYSVSGEGSQFKYYETSANRIKKAGDSGSADPDYWWERSPRSVNSNNFCRVDTDGTANVSGATNTRALAPFGCI